MNPAYTPEQRLLLLACSPVQTVALCDTLRSGDINWKTAIDAATQHSVLAILAHRVLACAVELPSQVKAELSDVALSSTGHALWLANEAERLASLLQANRIPAAIYKGGVQAQRYFGSMALRLSSDIDVAIPREQVAAAASAFTAAGYRPANTGAAAKVRAEHDCEMEYAAPGRAIVDLHWTAAPAAYRADVPVKEAWGRRCEVSVGGKSLPTFSHEDTLLVLCLHGAKHSWSRLLWIADSAAVATRSDLDWDLVERETARNNLRRIVAISLQLARELPGVVLSPDADRLAHERGAAPVAKLISDALFSNTRGDWAEYVLRARSRERWSDAIRLFAHMVFTPQPADFGAVTLPRAAAPGYRGVRLLRLLGKVGALRSSMNRRSQL